MPALTMFEVTPDHPVPISPQGGTASVTVLSGDTLYYADTPQVSAANNQGSVTAGNVQTFTNPAWVRSASLSTVLAQIAAPPAAALLGSDGTVGGPGGTPLTDPVVSAGSQASPLLFADSYMPAYQSNADVTTQFNQALAAASAIGSNLGTRCPLYLTPGRQYTVTNVIVPSYVEIVSTGAIINRGTINGNPTFDCSNSTDVCFRGLHFAPGAGTETGGRIHHIFTNLSQRIRVLDCYASNWGSSAVYVADSQYVWVIGNEFPNCGMAAAGTNAINLVNATGGATLPLKHFWVGHNFVSGNTIQCEMVSSGVPNRTDPDCDGHIFHNTLINLPTGAGWCMGIEQGASGAPVSGIEFTGNNCYQLNSANRVGSRTYAIVISSTVLNPNNITGITITGGRVISNATATNRGILIEASDSTISGVDIEAGEIDIVWQGAGGGSLTKLTVVGCQSHSGTGNQVVLSTNTDPTTFNMAGNTPVVAGAAAVPASGTAVAGQPYNRHFYVAAGASTCTMAVQGGPSPVIPASGFGTVFVPAGRTVTPTYTAAPTWTIQATT